MLFFVCSIFFNIAGAYYTEYSIIQNNSDTITGYVNDASDTSKQYLGTGLNFSINRIGVYFSTGGGLSSTTARLKLWCYTDENYTTPCSPKEIWYYNIVVPQNQNKKIFYIDNLNIPLVGTNYYVLVFGCYTGCAGGTNPNLYTYGANFNNYDNGYFSSPRANGVLDAFFEIYYNNIEGNVWGISPASETEITNLNSYVVVGYEGMTDYDSLYINFKNLRTGLATTAKEYKVSEIGDSGELEISLLDFNFDKNGEWYLQAVATYEGYQYQGEYFLSGYGWNWTENLTDNIYYLNINIEGFEPIFEMSDYNDWYAENVLRFESPTDMFVMVAGFIEPIFSNIGEFGKRIINYFDLNTAYEKGYQIGLAIPIFTYYVNQISLFLGGFPIIGWLFIILLILVGIFIFRLIMKFIPFLGG